MKNYYSNIRCSGLIFPMPVLVTCFPTPDLAYMFSLSKTFYLSHQSVMQFLRIAPLLRKILDPPRVTCFAKKHMTQQLHVFLCLALVTCFPTRLSAYMFSYAWNWLHVFPQIICPTPNKNVDHKFKDKRGA